ncbi:NmrA family NAD(P)-binding protein [Bacillus cytotoxicus]|uniref:NmrA-like domain-containing protein n=1 Tax=Bacillus cytotoxicus TaxID=580165 RepID=A0AAX2CGY3_9BACI|nr:MULTISPECIES: NmrA family NAD(P)-binding protein [Bacillus cereus group]MDH2864312.1 NmrA family NAD(P)-binding protein [Bacillus cytotoxicus]MDH2885280.1 NmrA family NAD(P)-binding protein [Bacillus cytotoxicus]SCL92476.1 Uncharacterized protein BCB44BAC_02058 [Bacillus cytotoxicus]SCN36290.1 Uncharacterized protein BC88300_02115 [Bacillus cytotoxicus]
MGTKDTIAVISANGKAGKFLVDQALQEGYQIRILTRHPEKMWKL